MAENHTRLCLDSSHSVGCGTDTRDLPCRIVLVFFAEPPKDRNNLRYLMGTLQVESFAKAVERFRADCGRYPNAREGLNGLTACQGIQGWHGPYLRDVPLDPWQRPYIYLPSVGSAQPEILSYGADGKPGGEFFNADISSRNLRYSIPDTPSVVRTRRLLMASWIAAWFCLFGSILALRKAYRSPNHCSAP
jgi:type II secretion system protein G